MEAAKTLCSLCGGNNHGDGHRTERERQRRETRRVDDSGRGRKERVTEKDAAF